MVEAAEIVVVLRERWENKWHCSLRLQVKHERKDADEITKTTTYPRTRRLEVALERRRVLRVVAPRAAPRPHHRIEEVLLEEAHRFR